MYSKEIQRIKEYSYQVLFIKVDGDLVLQFGYKLIGTAFGLLVGFLLPMQYFIYFIVSLIIADLYTAYRGGRRAKEKEAAEKGEEVNFDEIRFSSNRVGLTVDKLVGYFIALVVVRGVELLFLPQVAIEAMPVVYSVAGVIVLREIKSIFENIEKMVGLDLWSVVKEKLRSMLGVGNDQVNKK